MAKLERWKRASNYMGEEFFDYYVVMSQTRDSETLERANFEATLKLLGGENPPEVIVVRNSHWAVGWIEMILVHKNDVMHVEIAQEILDRYEQYPVVDEDLYSQMEQDDLQRQYQDWARDEAIKLLGWETKKINKKLEYKLYSATITILGDGYSLSSSRLERELKNS